MKALLINPAFPQTFWSLNKVVRMLGKGAIHPPLGLITLAALLPTDWELRLIDLSFQSLSDSDWDDCDLVLVSGMVVQYPGIIQTIHEAKNRRKVVVVGGPWAFHAPEEVLGEGADIVVMGEGETTVPLMLQSLSSGETGRIIHTDQKADLTQSPPPRYDLLEVNQYQDLAIQFSRGCPFQCDFCDVTLLLGRKVRTKLPEQVLKEMEALYEMGRRGAIFFVDDNFVGHPRRAKNLLKEIIPWMESRQYPFSFYTQASINLARDDEMVDLMVRAGFSSVFLGIETMDKESLKRSGKTQNFSEDIDEACERLNRAGLQIMAGCIMGFDHERPGADRRLIDFAARNSIPEMFVTLLQAAPGTALWKRLEEEGRILPLVQEELQDYSNQTGLCNFVPTRPMGEIVEEFTHLYNVLYDPAFFLERTFKHFSNLGPPRVKRGSRVPSLGETRAVLSVFFRHGILGAQRLLWWGYLLRAIRRFPKRLPAFIATCVKGAHFFDYRNTIAKKLSLRLKQRAERVETLTSRPSREA